MRLLYILLFSASLFAGEWTINDFTIRGKQFTQSATGILQGNLNRIPSYRAPKGDELLLRRRLDMNNYGLYVGKAEASAYTNLSRFTKPAGMSMDKLLKMKFFKDETPTGYNDVADIYFQDEYIYVKNLVRIFYNENGSWKSLEVAQGEKPGVLEISSTPSGAMVTIDGVVKGKTPYSFVMDAPTVEVEVSKSGYYIQSFTADAKPGAVKKFASSLKKRVTFSSNVEPEKMLDTTIQDIDQALELLRSIEGVYKKEKGRESTALAEFEKSFPKLKPQGEFEYDHEFAKRKAEYDVKKQKALAEAKVNASAFQSTISQMNEHIDQLSAKLYDLYLPVNSMKLGRYEINQNRFPVTISINQGAFQFTFTGYLIMNRNVAKRFKFSSDEKGVKIQYSKRKVKVLDKEYYIHYGGINVPFQGKVYELLGEPTLPSSVANSKEVLAYRDQVRRLENVRKEKERQEQIRKEKEHQEIERLRKEEILKMASLFPLYGFTPDISSKSEIKKVGIEFKGPYHLIYKVNNVPFRIENGKFKSITISRKGYFPIEWKKLGLDLEDSYENWEKALTRIGFNCISKTTPRTSTKSGVTSLKASSTWLKKGTVDLMITLQFADSGVNGTKNKGTLKLFRVRGNSGS